MKNAAVVLPGLFDRIRDVAATDGGDVVRVEIGTMADGSERAFALVTTQQSGLEQLYRIISPAPSGAPAWASGHGWLAQLRAGDSWLLLESSDDDEPANMSSGRFPTIPELVATARADAVGRFFELLPLFGLEGIGTQIVGPGDELPFQEIADVAEKLVQAASAAYTLNQEAEVS